MMAHLQTINEHSASPIDHASLGNITSLVQDKAKELFEICDKEGKGFINRVDMQRLHGELPLDDNQLREVFDQLDGDGNGFLTFQEFCDGFGGFLGLNSSYDGETKPSDTCESLHGSVQESNSFTLSTVLNQLKADSSFTSESEVVEMWNRLQKDEDSRPITAEDFVQTVLRELNETKMEKLAIEKKLKEQNKSHDDMVRELSEEMESQLQEERRKTIQEEVLRERNVSIELQGKLKQKEEYLKDVIAQQEDLEQKVAKLNSGKFEVKSENAQLLQLNESLAKELQKTRRDLEDTRIHMEMIKQRKEREEEMEHAEEEARKLDLEKKSLLTQLEVLREVNRKLRDDKDEAVEQSKKIPTMLQQRTSTPNQKYPLYTQGSNVGKYFPNNVFQSEVLSEVPFAMNRIDEGCHSYEDETSQTYDSSHVESSDAGNYNLPSPQKLVSPQEPSQNQNSNNQTTPDSLSDHYQRELTDVNFNNDGLISKENNNLDSFETNKNKEETAKSRFYRKLSQQGPNICNTEESFNLFNSKQLANENKVKVKTTRRDVVDGYVDARKKEKLSLPSPAPDRVYKVVFVGNSGVGKTSFIQQFVSKTFRAKISATIGVDYQMKTVKVDRQSVVLQLWDTAGQERYRSITRQYFRKADGIVVVYDVTNEKSFLAVRNWMQSVQEGADASAVILLIGNKSDIATDKSRQVTPKEGVKLAEEYGAMFSETSAKSGSNIPDSMLRFASELTRLEDEQKESVLSLAASDEETSKASSCCGAKQR